MATGPLGNYSLQHMRGHAGTQKVPGAVRGTAGATDTQAGEVWVGRMHNKTKGLLIQETKQREGHVPAQGR